MYCVYLVHQENIQANLLETREWMTLLIKISTWEMTTGEKRPHGMQVGYLVTTLT